MFRKTLAIILSGMLLTTALGFQKAQAKTLDEAQMTEKARATVLKLGVGRDARVEVKRRDKTKLKGYVSQAGADSFTVTDPKTGATSTLAYDDVEKVSKQGGGFSAKTWAIIGGAVAGTVITWIIVKPALCDGGAQTRGIC